MLFHNVSHYVPNLLASQQGEQPLSANPGTTFNENRIGNEVIARGLKIQLQFITDPLNTKFQHEILCV